MQELFHLMLNADELINEIVSQYGVWTYAVLFAIIFIETGLVVVTFFPGDGLLFSAGVLASAGQLQLGLLLVLLSLATILGNTSNYYLGRLVGERFFRKSSSKRSGYLEKAQHYYEQYGAKAVLLSRFFPFMRSFIPFVSGIARMPFARFTWANVAGGVLWIAAYLLLGYFFGEIPWVKQHYGLIFSVLILLLLLVLLGALLKALWRKLFPA
ncbi:MAG: hypothetical protein D6730_11630 [Bacteroidetes bacterium]|nr:MAG: hypothetical protein D6730_11630 [Bacteroidota bacterium]